MPRLVAASAALFQGNAAGAPRQAPKMLYSVPRSGLWGRPTAACPVHLGNVGSTVVAAWMIPVMSAFDHSNVGLQADVSITDTRAGRVLWRGTVAASNDGPPSGMLGEDDEHYTQVRLERVGSDLAVHVRDRLCASLSGV